MGVLQLSDEREVIAWHEAGHIVMAKHFGFNLKKILFRDKSVVVILDETPKNYYEIACIAMAGYFASSNYSGIDGVVCMVYCASDVRRAYKYMDKSKGLTKKSIRQGIKRGLDYNELLEWHDTILAMLEQEDYRLGRN